VFYGIGVAIVLAHRRLMKNKKNLQTKNIEKS